MVCLEVGFGTGGGMYLLTSLVVWSGIGEVSATYTSGFFYLEDWLLRRNSLTGEYWPFAAVFSFFLTTLERESEFRGQCILETSSSYFQM